MAWRVVGAAMEGEDLQGTVDLRLPEFGGFLIRESTEFASTTLDDVAGEMICELSSLSAGSRGIGEDVKIGEGARFDEAESGGVIVFGFAREAGEYIGAERSMGKKFANQLDAARIVFGAIPAMHGGEDAIRRGLQRHVEVGREAVIRSKEIDQVLGDVERFDGTDAQALDRSFVEDLTKEIDEFIARGEIAAIGAEIDAAENDFAKARFREAANFGENCGATRTLVVAKMSPVRICAEW